MGAARVIRWCSRKRPNSLANDLRVSVQTLVSKLRQLGFDPALHKYRAVIGANHQVLSEVGMPNLIVRNVTEDIIKALKRRATRHGTSAEAEHRRILAEALLKPRKRSFAEAIAAMPKVGRDSDFKRVQDQNSPDVLD